MDGFGVINKEINEQIAHLENALKFGNLGSYEEYKFLCGQLRGLITAQDIIKDLKSKMENDDD